MKEYYFVQDSTEVSGKDVVDADFHLSLLALTSSIYLRGRLKINLCHLQHKVNHRPE